MDRPEENENLALAIASVRFRRLLHLVGQSLLCPLEELEDLSQKLLTELRLDQGWNVCPPTSHLHAATVASGREDDIYFAGPEVRWGDDDRICRSKLRDLKYIDSEGTIHDPYYLNQLTAAVNSGASYLAVSIVTQIDPADTPKRVIERLFRWQKAAKPIKLTITDACLSNTPMIWAGRFPRW